jgi:enoyl-CoA hydratase/carnithine racemase
LRQVADADSAASIWNAILTCLEHIWHFDLPTIAMVHGACIGGGCLLAAACDFRIASHSSSFAVPVAKLGLLLDDRTIARVVAAGGVPFARELLVAARAINAERAYSLGFLIDTVDDEGLSGATSQLAAAIARNVQAAVSSNKRSLNTAAMQAATTPTLANETIVQSYLSEEFRKRVQSL